MNEAYTWLKVFASFTIAQFLMVIMIVCDITRSIFKTMIHTAINGCT